MLKHRNILSYICIFSLLIGLSACSGKKNTELQESQNTLMAGLKNISFNMLCYSEKEIAETGIYSRFYYPTQFKTLLNRKHFYKGTLVYYIEDYNPTKMGVIDSIGFYADASDNGYWIEDLLFRIEEERIADEISDMEELLEAGELPFEDIENPEAIPDSEGEMPSENQDNQDNQEIENKETERNVTDDRAAGIEKFLNSVPDIAEYSDKNSNLRFMELDNEILIPQIVPDGYIIVHSIGEKVSRNFYDILYRLKKKEYWNISTVENSVLEKTETFTYEDDSYKVRDKTITTENTDCLIKYNASGFVTENTSYAIYEDKKYLISKTSVKYNEDNQITEEATVTYFYNDDYSKQKDSFSKRYTYSYHENEEIPADFEYYEEDILKLKNTYSETKGKYIAQIFFDDGFSVKTYYEDGLRCRDIYYRNNEVVRTKDYER